MGVQLFCGVDALVRRLSDLAMVTRDLHTNNEINEVVSELYLLDAALGRLMSERKFVDDQDVDTFLDRLRCRSIG